MLEPSKAIVAVSTARPRSDVNTATIPSWRRDGPELACELRPRSESRPSFQPVAMPRSLSSLHECVSKTISMLSLTATDCLITGTTALADGGLRVRGGVQQEPRRAGARGHRQRHHVPLVRIQPLAEIGRILQGHPRCVCHEVLADAVLPDRILRLAHPRCSRDRRIQPFTPTAVDQHDELPRNPTVDASSTG